MTDEILVRREERVAIITLNRPERRNAINVPLSAALCAAIGAAQDAGCIVVTGSDPAFCAGLDLRDLGAPSLDDLPSYSEALRRSRVPLIAAVNGAAVTGGFEVALCCDFIIASERAVFADTHVRVGVFPGPVLVDLPRRVGMAKAREMSMTGNFIDAGEALRIGLANHVVAHDRLLPFTLEIARAIAEQDPAMIAGMREDWDLTGALPVGEAHREHNAFRTALGAGHRDSKGLAARHDAVLARSREQRDR